MKKKNRPLASRVPRFVYLLGIALLLASPINAIAVAGQAPASRDVDDILSDLTAQIVASGYDQGGSATSSSHIDSQHAVGTLGWLIDLAAAAQQENAATPEGDGETLPPATDEPDPPTEASSDGEGTPGAEVTETETAIDTPDNDDESPPQARGGDFSAAAVNPSGSVTIVKTNLLGDQVGGACFNVNVVLTQGVAGVVAAVSAVLNSVLAPILDPIIGGAVIRGLLVTAVATALSLISPNDGTASAVCTDVNGSVTVSGLFDDVVSAIAGPINDNGNLTAEEKDAAIHAALADIEVQVTAIETAAPSGYQLAGPVTIDTNLDDLVTNGLSVPVQNRPTLPIFGPGVPDGSNGSVTVIKVDALTGLPLGGACFTITATVLGDLLASVTNALTLALTPTLQALGFAGQLLTDAINSIINPLLAPLNTAILNGDTEDTGTGCTGVDGTIVIDGLLSDLLNAILLTVGGVLTQTQLDALLSSLSVDVLIEESDPPEGYEADDAVTANISLLSLITGYDHNASNELSNPPTPIPTGTPGAGGSVTVIKVDALNGARLANACFDVTATALGDVVAAVTAALTVELTPLLQALGLQGAILDAALANLLQPLLAPIIALVNGGETTSTATNQCTDVNGEVVIDGMLSNLLNAILVAVGGVLDQTGIDDLFSSLGVDLTMTETSPPPGYEQKEAVTTQITLLDLLNGSGQQLTNDALPTATATNTSVATETPTATATSEATNTPTATATGEATNTPTATPTQPGGGGSDGGSVTVIKVDALTGLPLAGACFDISATILGDGTALAATVNSLLVSILGGAAAAPLMLVLGPILSALGADDLSDSGTACSGVDGTIVIDGLLSSVLNPILLTVGNVLDATQLNTLLAGIATQVLISETTPPPGYQQTDAVTLNVDLLQLLTGINQEVENQPVATATATSTGIPTETATATNTAVATETPTATATGEVTETPTATATTPATAIATATITATPTQPGGGSNGGSVTIIKVDALTGLPVAGACFDVTAEILGGGGALIGPISAYLNSILDPIVAGPLIATLQLLLNGADASDTGSACSGVDGRIVISGLLAGILNPILTTLGTVLDATQLDALLATLLTRVTITETAPPQGYEGADATTTDIQLLQLLTGYQTQIENQPIATATATATSTSIATETATATNTAVATETPTATGTATETATATASATATATATEIPTETATASATATATATSTEGPTETATATATATEAPSETATATATSTEVSTATVTPTGTAEPTATSTTEPTETATATATTPATETATATATTLATETATATSTVPASETATATATLVSTATPTATTEPGTATATASATATGTAIPEMVTLGIWVIDCGSDPGTVTGNDVAVGNLPANCRVDEGVRLSATANGIEIPGGPFVTGPDGFVAISAPLGSTVVVTEDVDSVNGGQSVLLSVRALQAAPTGTYLPRENPITIADAQEGESAVFVNLLQAEPTATATASSTPSGGATSTPGSSATATTVPVTDLPSTGGGIFESKRSLNWMLGLLLAFLLLMFGVARAALDSGKKTHSRRD